MLEIFEITVIIRLNNSSESFRKRQRNGRSWFLGSFPSSIIRCSRKRYGTFIASTLPIRWLLIYRYSIRYKSSNRRSMDRSFQKTSNVFTIHLSKSRRRPTASNKIRGPILPLRWGCLQIQIHRTGIWHAISQWTICLLGSCTQRTTCGCTHRFR